MAPPLLFVDVPSLENIAPSVTREIVSGAIEIGLLTWLIYVALKFLHGTRGLAVMKGAGLMLLLLILSLQLIGLAFDLSFPRLAAAGGVLLPVIGVVLVVLFQPELRTGFTRLSERGGRGRAPAQLADFTESIGRLSAVHTGALVVFEQHTGLKTVERTGVRFDASLSGALIESIFFPRSPLHDGAVLVRDGRIVAASCMLPLTDATNIDRDLGTRHRAAMGVTEESDCLAVVVSEETGRISLAQRGLIQPVDGPEDLLVKLTVSLAGGGLELAAT